MCSASALVSGWGAAGHVGEQVVPGWRSGTLRQLCSRLILPHRLTPNRPWVPAPQS